MSARAWAGPFAGLLFLAACGPRSLSPGEVDTLVNADPSFAAARAELMVTTGELLACPLLQRYDGRVFPKARCEEIGEIGASTEGRMVVTLPRQLPRRVIEVKSLSPYNKAANERSAVVRWEWVADSLDPELKSCFELQPREALAILELKDGRWAVKQILVEKLAVHSGRCG
jgi:hypothetical protein